MFERRLKILLIVLSLPGLAVIARLVQMQIVCAGSYAEAADGMLRREQARYFPCLRGEIQDHEGRRLAYDAPVWDICVRYEVLSGNLRYLRALARERDTTPEKLQEQVRASWQAIADLSGEPLEDLHREEARIVRQVTRVKAHISNLRGIEVPLVEEKIAHPIVRGLNQNRQAEARVALASYPWVEVVAGQQRLYAGGESMGHLLGFLNEVDDDVLERDPQGEDELAAYQLGDLRGVSGLERLGEPWLRGRRGRQEEDIEGHVLSIVEPVNGRNYRLTIDLPLQQLIYEKLKAAVAANETSTGAAAVVLDVPSRQILAMVSYPGFDPNIRRRERSEERLRLMADEVHRPFDARAFAERYPPGSLVKPVVLAGAWTDHTVTAETRIVCNHQLSSTPPHFRCTGTHGPVDPISALRWSCNIFFYRVGESMGVPRLAYWLDQAGLGRPTGLDLVEESNGQLPKEGRYKGEARLTAIGQWQVQATPLQAANMLATVASGAWRPVTIWADDPRERRAVTLPVSPEAWRTVREGMYEVVNKPHGTAHEHIHLENTGDLVLLGKTGSAQVDSGWIVERIFVCKFPNGDTEEYVAANDIDLYMKFPQARKAEITERRAFTYFPTAEMDPTHAWFGGYLTTKDHYLDSSAGGRLNVALVVLIEFGGRGGGVAAPVAGEIVQAMIDMQQGSGFGVQGSGLSRGDSEATAGPIAEGGRRP